MIFGSNPSVYTLPGTWEAQPMIPIELAVATTVGLTSIAFIGMLIAGVSAVSYTHLTLPTTTLV